MLIPVPRNIHYMKVGMCRNFCSTLNQYSRVETLPGMRSPRLEAGSRTPDFYSPSYEFSYKQSNCSSYKPVLELSRFQSSNHLSNLCVIMGYVSRSEHISLTLSLKRLHTRVTYDVPKFTSFSKYIITFF